MFDPKDRKKNEAHKGKEGHGDKALPPSRRDFLKGMAVGAGGLALSSLAARDAGAIDFDTFPLKQGLRNEVVEQGRITHDYRKCVGCQVCEVTCAMHNHSEVNPSKSRIKIYTYQPTVFVGIVCQQCSDRPCIEACPVTVDQKSGRKALYENPKTKSLAVDPACIYCQKCIEACQTKRNGNLRANDAIKEPDGYCTLCDGDPQCVKKCPQGALAVVPRVLDGRFASKNPDKMAEEFITQLYGGPKTIVDNWK